MNAQAKLLIYLAMIAAIFLFVQEKFNLFDIQFVEDTKQVKEDEPVEEEYLIEKGELIVSREEDIPVKVDIEIVDTEKERTQGLMFREELGTFSGMLFVFEQEGNNAFWMKNTKIPLDMIFINSEKEIVETIENAQPCLEGHVCPRLRPEVEYMYCLEVNSGFVEENRVEIGDTVSWEIL